jgi:hypothetical protein
MFDYALSDLGYDPEAFFSQFLISGVAKSFEKGNPKCIAGLSGASLRMIQLYEQKRQDIRRAETQTLERV